MQVLWRRRVTVAAVAGACIALSLLYLLVATPVYRATARVLITQNAPHVYSDNPGYPVLSETFIDTQRDVFRSATVLRNALETSDYRKLHTFSSLAVDPVAYLQAGNGFEVDVQPKSDVMTLSFDSQYPDEAVLLLDNIIRSYSTQQADQERANGDAMVKVLRKQRDALDAKRQAAMQNMVRSQQESGIISFHSNDSGNTMASRAASLSAALSNAQLATIDYRAQRKTILEALSSPEATSQYVQALQFHSRETGDREYDELRSQLVQQRLALATYIDVQGKNHPYVAVQRARVKVVEDQIAQKEKAIAEAQLANVTDELAASDQRERDLKAALAGQEKSTLDLSPRAAQYANLETDLAQYQRQIETLDQRIAQVSADAIDAPLMNVRVLDWAAAAKSPVKPRKGVTLLAALAVGIMLGIGGAMFRDWQDSRIRTPEEALALTGAPVLAVVPRISLAMPTTARAQVVQLDPASAAAEAYRAIRTSLSTGAAREAKMVLVASPGREDGKSTTAANLAITFAHAGHRTLLLDCDLRQPVQHLVFTPDDGVASGEGLTSALAGEVRISSIVYQTRVPGLCLLPCGPVPANPSELLAGKRFEQLLDSLSASFDRVVIDSSALGVVSDARSLAALADATLLVVRMNQSTRAACAQAIGSLLRVGANIAGIIANDVPLPRNRQEYFALQDGSHNGGLGSWGARLPALPRRKLGAVEPINHPGVVSHVREPEWEAPDSLSRDEVNEQ